MSDNPKVNLVKNTLESTFDKERFLIFTKNIFKKFDESKAFPARGYVKHKFKNTTPIIKTYERLGTYTDPEDNKIDILIVYLNKRDSIDKARTTLRNFVADYLKRRDSKEAALVAFVPPDSEDWRFSLVKMEYRLDTSGKKLKTKEELTPARRFSFLVGKNEKSHTAQKQLLPILSNDQLRPTLSNIEEAFNVEVVTKEFFEKYKKLFLDVREALDKIVAKDTKIKTDFQKKNIDTTDFTKKLLGQIVFLYFLQKKGWFGVERDSDWGTGPKDFLRRLLEKQITDYKNFFNNILEPLFYGALATERQGDFYSRFDCKIPFLNGGLFDPLGNYDWVHTDICLPDELFSNSRPTKEGDIGDGILDIFDRYNFTVKEDEPLEKEVAVDPEMLGNVFEKLLDVKDRKSKGTYYTPREIVHYMCQESLINHLTTNLDGKVKQTDIETLIHTGESVVEHEAHVVANRKETEKYKFKLHQSIRKNASLIDKSLEKIKVCDPAVGSGAFLVGMMAEIIKARNTLSSYLPENNRSIYAFKRHAIQDCLYGVDIDPSAVEIAKLRLWLSLIVDEQDIKQIKPLPNLDYKIMQGNSLLEEYEGIKLFDEGIVSTSPFDNTKAIEQAKKRQDELQRDYIKLHSTGELKGIKKQQIELELKKQNDLLKKLTKATQPDSDSLFDKFSQAKKKADQLKNLHRKFFETANKNEKDELKKQIEALEWELVESSLLEQNKQSLIPEIEHFKKANIKPFFLWKLNFSEVFEKNGGFDIVIANPPYVRQEKIKNQKAALQNFEVYNSTSDLYTYFYELSYNVLRNEGILTFISSNKWMRAKYGEKLRNFFRNKMKILQLVDFNGHKVFEATVDTNIIILQKEEVDGNFIVPFVNIQSDFTGENLTKYLPEHQQSIMINQLRDTAWSLVDEKYLGIKEKIEKTGESLKNWGFKSYMGIKTGYNEAFIIDEQKKNKLISENTENLNIIHPLLKGKDIGQYFLKFRNRYLILAQNGIDVKKEYRNIFDHLTLFKKQLEKRWDRGKHWSNLRDCDYYNEFGKAKIIYPDINERLSFAYDENGYYSDNTTYILGTDSKYILAVLNSSLINFYYGFISSQLGSRAVRHFTIYIEQIPVRQISEKEQEPFTKLVDKILVITTDGDYLQNPTKQTKVREYEKQIDQMVYELYGLTPEEIKIVEEK